MDFAVPRLEIDHILNFEVWKVATSIFNEYYAKSLHEQYFSTNNFDLKLISITSGDYHEILFKAINLSGTLEITVDLLLIKKGRGCISFGFSYIHNFRCLLS